MLALATLCSLLLISHSSAQIPPSLRTYSSSFAEPLPPLINAEFRCNYNQHKWYRFTESSDSNMTLPCQVFSLYSSLRRDQNVSHVASGFLYNSAAQQKVRADVVFDGSLGSSLFDFAKTTPDGLVENSVYLFTPSVAAKPSCNVYQVNSDFPLVPSDFLVANNAVFAGYQEDSMNGLVSLWDILYQGAVPTTLLLNENNTLVGYEYFAPDRRTRVVTNFFNVILGVIDPAIFLLPKCGK